ncbi:MAG: small subunit ribosomal protein S4 [Nitriliruptoraceae bacterium]|jgi:small subunit ribosomal protein S4
MARYTGPATKKSRRLGVDLKGGDKNFDKRPYPPGDHGRGRMKDSEYRNQLQEKQKARYWYGVLEKQFRKYYAEAARKDGLTGENLLILLERRLDNIVYRGGFARTRRESRQMVNHRHILVNDKCVDIPSFSVKPGDVVKIKVKNRQSQAVIGSLELFGNRDVPGFLDTNTDEFTITVRDLPVRSQIDAPVTEQLIVELYSK